MQDLTCPQVGDGEDSLHVGRVAVNTLNKHSQSADRCCVSSWELGWVLIISCSKKFACNYMLNKA
jgi:hypothetical protein